MIISLLPQVRSKLLEILESVLHAASRLETGRFRSVSLSSSDHF